MSQDLHSKLCGPHDSRFDSPPSSLCHNHDGDDGNAGTESLEEPTGGRKEERSNREQVRILAILVSVLRKSLITCSVEREEICSMDIGWPTNVRHVTHVTFDRFNGFLGLPFEFEPEVPRRVPSASASVFGVSAESMQCSYDRRGNSVPTILLLMQRCLYSQGGLRAEGIFRINAENGQEEFVRYQLNNGIVPHGIDLHCLAGLIKAWFRELPTGVLDSLTPEQVMHCNTEDDCTQLVRILLPTESALLDWAINLMADVVQHEHYNKMNARNIAMVFAPNMTQMADPLTALIHAVQVMNFLKTLVMKTLREREESAGEAVVLSSCTESPNNNDGHSSSKSIAMTVTGGQFSEKISYDCISDEAALDKLSKREGWLVTDGGENFRSFQDNEDDDKGSLISGYGSPVECQMAIIKNRDYESMLDRLSFRKGVRKLCRHPVFQLSRAVKKTEVLGL